MQSLYFMLVAALIAAAVANPTGDAASKSSVPARQEAASATCKQHFKQYDRCYIDCLFKHLGILDSEGRYVPSAFTEVYLFFYPEHTQQEVAEATTTCNSAKDKLAAGCERTRGVYLCIKAELEKITDGIYD